MVLPEETIFPRLAAIYWRSSWEPDRSKLPSRATIGNCSEWSNRALAPMCFSFRSLSALCGAAATVYRRDGRNVGHYLLPTRTGRLAPHSRRLSTFGEFLKADGPLNGQRSATGWETNSPLQVGNSRKQTLAPSKLWTGLVRRHRTRCEKRASLSQTRQLYFQAQFAPPQDKDRAKTAACKAASNAPKKFWGGTS